MALVATSGNLSTARIPRFNHVLLHLNHYETLDGIAQNLMAHLADFSIVLRSQESILPDMPRAHMLEPVTPFSTWDDVLGPWNSHLKRRQWKDDTVPQLFFSMVSGPLS